MNLPSIVSRLSKTIYVVLYKTAPSPRHPQGQLTLLIEPGINKVWSSRNQMLAKHHADLNKGQASTWQDAWNLLVKEYGSLDRLENDLAERIRLAQDEAGKTSAPATDQPGMRLKRNEFNDNFS